MIGKTRIGYVVHAWGAQMSAWISTALASPSLPCRRLRLSRRDLAHRGARTTASIFPRRSTSARSPRSRSESRLTRRLGKNKNSPPRSRPSRLPIRARLLGQVRDQDERRLSAILGHWSDGSVSTAAFVCAEPWDHGSVGGMDPVSVEAAIRHSLHRNKTVSPLEFA